MLLASTPLPRSSNNRLACVHTDQFSFSDQAGVRDAMPRGGGRGNGSSKRSIRLQSRGLNQAASPRKFMLDRRHHPPSHSTKTDLRRALAATARGRGE